MEDKKIYWTGVEYRYGEGSSNYGKLQGGFVYGFVQARDARDALNRFDEKLIEEALIPVIIEFISIYDIEMEWETEEQTENFCQLCNEARESTEVIFDDFYAFENEV